MTLLRHQARGAVAGLALATLAAPALMAHTADQTEQSFVQLAGISLIEHARSGDALPRFEVGRHNSALWPNILYGFNEITSVSVSPEGTQSTPKLN